MLGPDVDSPVHWARDQPLIAATTVTVGPDLHLRLRATREAQHHLCFMEQGIQKSAHHDQGFTSLGGPCIQGRGLEQVWRVINSPDALGRSEGGLGTEPGATGHANISFFKLGGALTFIPWLIINLS